MFLISLFDGFRQLMLKDLIRAWRVARFPFFLGVDDVRVAADVAQDPIHTEQTFARTKLFRFRFE